MAIDQAAIEQGAIKNAGIEAESSAESQQSLADKLLPEVFRSWLASRGWRLRDHQAALLRAFAARQSTLLIAPTGGGKTLAGFLPSLVDLHQQMDIHRQPRSGLHTLYLSPLKALTNDVNRNLQTPIDAMGLNIKAETRTGDTPSHVRQRQRKKPPHILLTTPESLMLMLSYSDAPNLFGRVQSIIVDESHSLATNKRGDLTLLALAKLSELAPKAIRFGLSATVANPETLAAWLGPSGRPCAIEKVQNPELPNVSLLAAQQPLPLASFLPKYAIADVYQQICKAKTCIVFVNTRAQAELIFQLLWQENRHGLPIGLYHGSLSKEQRQAAEAAMASGKLRAVVSTSALEMGVDWGDVDLVIQLGAPKGVSRLLQRIGRSNHRMDEPSKALLVPSSRFEFLECFCALKALANHELDGDDLLPGALEIIPQFIINCACSAPIDPGQIYACVISAYGYRDLTRATFDQLFRFAVDGGYTLSYYDRYQRLVQNSDGLWEVESRRVMQRHRQNIGTIVEATMLRVKRLRRKHEGKIIGQVEEYFAQQLTPGDTFMFAGEVLKFEGIHDMTLEARPAKKVGEPLVPSYVGGQLPLSTYLASSVRALLADEAQWQTFDQPLREWLQAQKTLSALPNDQLLIEHFPFRKFRMTVFYTFAGRKANQTLGMLITKRMETLSLQAISFSVTDYGLSVFSLKPIDQSHIQTLFTPEILGDELENWIVESPMLKRSFRRVAMVSGLIEKTIGGKTKTSKQVTFSTDLIYDVLRRFEPDHILLKVTREDAERELLDINRLHKLLINFSDRILYKQLDKPSPLSIPVILAVSSEKILGEGIDRLVAEAKLEDEAYQLLDEALTLASNSEPK